jgi:hypothetical protein
LARLCHHADEHRSGEWANSAASIIVDVELPLGHHFNPAAAQRYKVTVENGAAIKLDLQKASQSQEGPQTPTHTFAPGTTNLHLHLTSSTAAPTTPAPVR